MPQIPRLVHRFLNDQDEADRLPHYMRQLMVENRRQSAWLAVIAAALALIAGLLLYRVF